MDDDTTPFDGQPQPQSQPGQGSTQQPWWQRSADATGPREPWTAASSWGARTATEVAANEAASRPRRPGRLGSGLTALLVAAGLVVGAGGGHLLWSSPATAPSATAASVTAPSVTAPSVTAPSATAPSAVTPQAGAGSGVAAGGSTGPGSSGTTGPVSSTIDGAAIAAQAYAGIVDVNVVLGYAGAEGAGTGIVLSSDGLVLTNNHVIDGATQIRVRSVTSDRSYPATVVGYDASRDVALLALQGASGLTPATLGSSRSLAVGQSVVGVGNGGGTGGTPSWVAGTITGLDQSITASNDAGADAERLSGLVETNLAIVPGYSGGPLLDADGTVVGIDTAAAASNGAASARYGPARGTGASAATPDAYAVGIDDALAVVHQIEQGATSGTVHVGRTAFLGVAVDPSATGGAGVAQVVPGGAAAQAGLAAGDTITTVDGRPIASSSDLSAVISTLTPGHRVSITVVGQDGAQRTLTVTPAAGPAQ